MAMEAALAAERGGGAAARGASAEVAAEARAPRAEQLGAVKRSLLANEARVDALRSELDEIRRAVAARAKGAEAMEATARHGEGADAEHAADGASARSERQLHAQLAAVHMLVDRKDAQNEALRRQVAELHAQLRARPTAASTPSSSDSADADTAGASDVAEMSLSGSGSSGGRRPQSTLRILAINVQAERVRLLASRGGLSVSSSADSRLVAGAGGLHVDHARENEPGPAAPNSPRKPATPELRGNSVQEVSQSPLSPLRSANVMR
mmetsp:Transcript_34370/g.85681  ORF Transcript_34370/g.85681 Transcript_34370/m.85681 type:complete len:267 (+) Transcript_34370:2-802(+)